MEKQIITFSANEQTLTKTGGVDCYASNIVSYIEAQFALGENWSGYDSVRAVWFTDFVGGISTVLDSLGTCIVPYEVLTRKGEVKVNLVGSIADEDVLTDRLTTCPVTAVVVKCNAKVAGANSTPITPSEYEQFVASVRTDADRAEEASVSARTSADEAEASAQNASESASASAVSASDSARSATASAGYAQNASESAQSAENAKDDAILARDEIRNMSAEATTLPAGSDATASYSDGVLSLGIPKGDKGDKGNTGETGATPQLSIGTVTTTTEPSVTITGTAENPVLNFGLVKGDKGDTGDVSQEQLDAAVSDLKSDLNNLEETVLIESSFNPTYQQGWIRADGSLGNASMICRTGYLNLWSSKIIITPKTGYKIKVAEYNKINDSSTFTRFIVGYTAETAPARFESISGKYYVADISSVDGTAVTTSNIPVDAITISYITFTDKTLSAKDKAADAKTVGDKFTELLQDVETIHNEIGYGDISFEVKAGVNHSSYSDVVNINIFEGEKFHVDFSGNVSSPQIYALYSDDTNGRLITGFTYDGVASKDITGIGIFIPGGGIPSDTTVKTVVYTSESIYGKTTRIPDEKNIITTVLGANLPDDISGYGVSSAYATEMKNAIDAWMGYYAGDTKKVPFIVHTDQHGRLTVVRQGIFNLLNWTVNWEGVSAIFNLGDTVVDHWENDDTNTNPLLRNVTLENARICTKNIPDNKQINVYGNHETWYSGTLETTVSGVLPSLQYNNPYFASDGLITKMLDDNSGMKVVYDTKNNVKYLVVAGWDYADKPSGNIGYQWYWINKSHLEWIISQMTENDGYDLVLVSHVPLEMAGTGSIDPISGNSIESANPIYITHGTSYLLPLWNARKAKTSGSIVYNGETITFDFTSCENDCLCALAGHTHYDGVEYLDGNGLLQVAFDWFANDTIHFGIIDRRNAKIKCWKLSGDNSVPAIDIWEMPFNKLT